MSQPLLAARGRWRALKSLTVPCSFVDQASEYSASRCSRQQRALLISSISHPLQRDQDPQSNRLHHPHWSSVSILCRRSLPQARRERIRPRRKRGRNGAVTPLPFLSFLAQLMSVVQDCVRTGHDPVSLSRSTVHARSVVSTGSLHSSTLPKSKLHVIRSISWLHSSTLDAGSGGIELQASDLQSVRVSLSPSSLQA